MFFVLAGTVTDGALPGSHHFHYFTGPTVALLSSTTLTVSSCFVHFDDTLGGTETLAVTPTISLGSKITVRDDS